MLSFIFLSYSYGCCCNLLILWTGSSLQLLRCSEERQVGLVVMHGWFWAITSAGLFPNQLTPLPVGTSVSCHSSLWAQATCPSELYHTSLSNCTCANSPCCSYKVYFFTSFFSLYLFWLSSAFPQPSLIRKQNLQTKAAKPRCFQVSPHAPEVLCLEVGCRSAAGICFPCGPAVLSPRPHIYRGPRGGTVTCFSQTTPCYQFTRTQTKGEGQIPFSLPRQTNACNY